MSQFDKYIKIGQEMISESKEVISEGVIFTRVNEYAKNNAKLKKLLPVKELKEIYIGVNEESVYVSRTANKFSLEFEQKLRTRKIDNVIDFYAVLFDNIENVEKLDSNELKSHYIDSKANVQKVIINESIAIANLDGINEIYFVL